MPHLVSKIKQILMFVYIDLLIFFFFSWLICIVGICACIIVALRFHYEGYIVSRLARN